MIRKFTVIRDSEACSETLSGTCVVSRNKWIFAIILPMTSNQGDLLVLRLVNMIQVNWHAVHWNLRRLRQRICNRDVCYILQDLVEMVATLVSDCLLSWCDVKGKQNVMSHVGLHDKDMDYTVVQQLVLIDFEQADNFSQNLRPRITKRTDTVVALRIFAEDDEQHFKLFSQLLARNELHSVYMLTSKFKFAFIGTYLLCQICSFRDVSTSLYNGSTMVLGESSVQLDIEFFCQSYLYFYLIDLIATVYKLMYCSTVSTTR